MKKNLLLVSILATMSMMAVACDDKDSEERVDGTLRCNVNAAGVEQAEVWQNGKWVLKEICSDSHCSDGACLTVAYACDNNAKPICVDPNQPFADPDKVAVDKKTTIRYCSNGEVRYTNCAAFGGGMVCEDSEENGATCVPNQTTSGKECKGEETRCAINASGSVRQRCSDGVWTEDPCTNGTTCSGGKCVKPENACQNGAGKCMGKTAYVCENYNWVEVQECADGCHRGACVGADFVPAVGEPCGGFDSACVDNNGVMEYRYCGRGEVRSYECPEEEGMVCAEFADGYDCGFNAELFRDIDCEKEGQILTGIFRDSCADGILYYLECKKSTDGKLYATQGADYSTCNGNVLVACQDGAEVEAACSSSCKYYEQYNAAQCEVNGKREDVDFNGGGNAGGGALCTEDGSACKDGHEQLQEWGTDDYDLCDDDFIAQCKAEYDADSCVQDAQYAYCVEACSAQEVGKTKSMCSKGDGGKYIELEYKCVKKGDSYLWLDYAGAYCNGSAGGSDASWEDCSAETCTLTDGSSVNCGDVCVQYAGAGAKAWCDEEGNVDCGVNPPSGSGSGSDSEWEACTADSCHYQGMDCIDYCAQSGTKAWCNYSTGDATCSATNPGGGSSEPAETCDSSYVETCTGNVNYYCSKGVVDSIDCNEMSEYYGEDYTCVLLDGVGACVSDEDKCTEKGATKKLCEVSYSYGAITYAYTCTEDEDGNLYWGMDYENIVQCDKGNGYCSDSETCHDREACDDTYVSTCSGGVALSCYSGEVYSETCYEGSTCAVIDGEASCHDAEDQCDLASSEDTTACELDAFLAYFGMEAYVETVTGCAEASDGKGYKVEKSYKYCANKCNADNTGCDAAGYDED